MEECLKEIMAAPPHDLAQVVSHRRKYNFAEETPHGTLHFILCDPPDWPDGVFVALHSTAPRRSGRHAGHPPGPSDVSSAATSTPGSAIIASGRSPASWCEGSTPLGEQAPIRFPGRR